MNIKVRENADMTSGQIANMMKANGRRRELSSYWDKYAEMLGVKKEYRMPRGNANAYHWYKKDIERLLVIVANGIEAE